VRDVKEIVVNKAENMFNLKVNEAYSSICIESPEYIIGFEGDDFALKNFAV